MRDTIFALSSGNGAAGVAVFRLSGPNVCAVLQKLIGNVPEKRQASLRVLKDPETGEIIDSGLVLFFPKPHSFTGEDVAELQVHGSLAVLRQIITTLQVMPGLRAADAGEFTRRAFFNGKMDLLEVEALGDLLVAETKAQLRLAHVEKNHLRREALCWRQEMLDLLALVEACLDFSDESDVAGQFDEEISQRSLNLAQKIKILLQGVGVAERIRKGIRIAILGAPNAGKSTLFNMLAARDVAITSPIPGTTRDVLEIHLDLKGLPIILMDTAGLREQADVLETIGIERAREAASLADLVIWLSALDDPHPCPYKDALRVYSKCDLLDADKLHNKIAETLQESEKPLFLSSLRGDGVQDFIDILYQHAQRLTSSGEVDFLVAHTRQADELRQAAEALDRAAFFIANTPELAAENFRLAAQALDRLVGKIHAEDILGVIFSRFCIGK